MVLFSSLRLDTFISFLVKNSLKKELCSSLSIVVLTLI